MIRHLTNYAASVLLGGALLAATLEAGAQAPEEHTDNARQEITAAADIGVDAEKLLGLITINGGCSGTLLNRFWILTARHCVQANNVLVNAPTFIPPLLGPEQVSVTATWAPGRIGVASRLLELGGVNLRDIILIYLGRANLGATPGQRPHLTPLRTSDTVTQYGQGLLTFATVGATGRVTLGTGLGVYRSANFNPSAITGTGYELSMNRAGQVGHGGDSGGPTVVMDRGVNVGIAGVQSSCVSTGTAPGSPANPSWVWATGISSCHYVSVQPVLEQIRRAILVEPYCKPSPGCLMSPIVYSVLKP